MVTEPTQPQAPSMPADPMNEAAGNTMPTRTQAFQQGAGFQDSENRFNSVRDYQQTSVIGNPAFIASGNGMSREDAQKRLLVGGGQLPPTYFNGAAPSTTTALLNMNRTRTI